LQLLQLKLQLVVVGVQVLLQMSGAAYDRLLGRVLLKECMKIAIFLQRRHKETKDPHRFGSHDEEVGLARGCSRGVLGGVGFRTRAKLRLELMTEKLARKRTCSKKPDFLSLPSLLTALNFMASAEAKTRGE